MSAEETLKQVAAEVSVCTKCVLHKTRKKSVPGGLLMRLQDVASEKLADVRVIPQCHKVLGLR